MVCNKTRRKKQKYERDNWCTKWCNFGNR
jgi:hypothetical protein